MIPTLQEGSASAQGDAKNSFFSTIHVQQVKIRIFQPWELQNRLKLLGAAFLGAWDEKDIYYLQPAGSFLKIKKTKNSCFFIKLRKDGKGNFTKEIRLLRNPEKKEKELGEKFGIVKTVEKRVRSYSIKGMEFRIQSIPELWDFLILEGNVVKAREMLRKLGMEKPEFVSLAFSEML